MSFYDPTIRDVQAKLDTLVDTQAAAVNSLSAAVQNVQSDKRTANDLLSRNASALVIADDAGRYAALSRASEGLGENYNFTAIVHRWTQEDEQNRKDRAALGEKWGTRQEVARNAAENKSNVDLRDEALGKVSPEIGKFDETTKAIREHNERYKDKPAVQITLENHDKFEELGGRLGGIKAFFKAAWRVTKWLFGFKGEYRAYKIMSAYDKKYGDYFEDVADIQAKRDNEKVLKADRAGFQAEYEKYYAIGSQMDGLDRSYKGAEGIARGVRDIVLNLLPQNDQFVEGILREIPGAEAQNAALATVKQDVLAVLETKAAKQLTNAQNTYNALNGTLKFLKDTDDVPNAVRDDRVSYSIDTTSSNVTVTARTSKASAAAINQASDAVETYTAPVGTSLAAMKEKVKSIGTVDIDSNQLLVDMSGLETGVRRIVKEYRDELERQRLAELERQRKLREAEIERNKTLNDTFNNAGRTTTPTPTIHVPAPSPAPSNTGFSVGNGNNGISRPDTGFKVGGGAAGIRRG